MPLRSALNLSDLHDIQQPLDRWLMGQEFSNTSTDQQTPKASNQPIDLLSDLESRLGQLKDWQAQTDQQLKEMQEEAKRIDALRDESQAMKDACEERQKSLDEQQEQLNNELDSLASQEQELNDSREQLLSLIHI